MLKKITNRLKGELFICSTLKILNSYIYTTKLLVFEGFPKKCFPCYSVKMWFLKHSQIRPGDINADVVSF